VIELWLIASMSCHQKDLAVTHTNLYIRGSAVIFMKDEVVSCKGNKTTLCRVQTDKESLVVYQDCDSIMRAINQIK
jgi:hypothetical protein